MKAVKPKASDNEEGSDKKGGELRYETDVGSKCRVSHKGLRCLYTNAKSMGNKQGELEVLVHESRYYFVAFTETWWDETHD